jgi:hypothetical protein
VRPQLRVRLVRAQRIACMCVQVRAQRIACMCVQVRARMFGCVFGTVGAFRGRS